MPGFCWWLKSDGVREVDSWEEKRKDVHFINQPWGSSENFDVVMFLLFHQRFALQDHKA